MTLRKKTAREFFLISLSGYKSVSIVWPTSQPFMSGLASMSASSEPTLAQKMCFRELDHVKCCCGEMMWYMWWVLLSFLVKPYYVQTPDWLFFLSHNLQRYLLEFISWLTLQIMCVTEIQKQESLAFTFSLRLFSTTQQPCGWHDPVPLDRALVRHPMCTAKMF